MASAIFNPRDPVTAWKISQLLELVANNGSDDAVSLLWARCDFPDAQIITFPSTPQLPSVVAAIMTGEVFVGVNGTDNFSQAWNYTIDALFVDYDRYGHFVNATFETWGKKVWLELQPLFYRNRVKYTFAGHSYGGAVAIATAVQATIEDPTEDVTIITFGSPRVGTHTFYDSIKGKPIRRWKNSGDPVPYLPPRVDELLVVPGKYRLPTQWLFHDWAQPAGGEYLWPTGQHKPDNAPPDGDVSASQGAGIGAVASKGQEPSTHRLAYYTRCLYAAARRDDPVRAVLLSEADVALRKLLTQTRSQQHNLFWEPDMSPFIPHGDRAKVQKYGGKYSVVLEGLPVITAPTRTLCKTAAKALNHFLRRMQVMDGFLQTNWTSAFGAYLNIAAAGGKGFRPDQLHLEP